MKPIPIMKPQLPAAGRISPYLGLIDQARTYSNFGPLVQSLEDRLAAHFGLSNGTIATVANATLGLTLALTAQGAKPGTLCAIPAWTFVASVHAVIMAGLVPFFVDVDLESWALDVDRMADAIAAAPAPIGAVMPVAPFGRPVSAAAWDAFQRRTAIPVVIDAAAGFDAVIPGATPAVVSLHATKVIGVGEGGFVVSTDRAIIGEIRTRSNFGFAGTREAAVPAANAKLSEYHAAVGLAALDEWADVRREWLSVAQAYREALSGSDCFRFQDGFGQAWIASTCVVRTSDSGARRAERELADCGIETRRWWGNGAHVHPATTDFPRTHLPGTEALAHSTIAMPFFRDLGVADIGRVADAIQVATAA